jgi:hypothetical protein
MTEAKPSGGNSGIVADARDAKGRFAAGNPGRPIGTRHRITRAVEALLEGEAEALTRRAIDQALAGDVTALRLCLERLLPPIKSKTVHFDLPEIKSAQDGLQAIGATLRAVASGDIAVDEGLAVAAMIETYRKHAEIVDIDERLTKLENLKDKS